MPLNLLLASRSSPDAQFEVTTYPATTKDSLPTATVGTALSGIISAGSLVDQLFTTSASGSFSAQTSTQFAFQFTATSSSTTIVFQAADSPVNAYGPVIDTVSAVLSDPVLEPSTLNLLFS